MTVLCTILYGSHLYGTNIETSDTDYKTIYLPSEKDMFLLRNFKNKNQTTGSNDSKNESSDIDHEHIPFQKFIEAYMSGQAYAVEIAMAIVQGRGIVTINPTFEHIVVELVSKYPLGVLSGMVGYAVKTHADRSRTTKNKTFLMELYDRARSVSASLKSVSDFYDVFDLDIKELSERLNVSVFVSEIVVPSQNNKTYQYLEILGKKIDMDSPIHTLCLWLKNAIDSYGSRSQKPYDSKSMYHAVRVVMQVNAYYEHGKFEFPLPETETLLNIRNGVISEDQANEILDKSIDFMRSLEYDRNKETISDDVVYGWVKSLLEETV